MALSLCLVGANHRDPTLPSSFCFLIQPTALQSSPPPVPSPFHSNPRTRTHTRGEIEIKSTNLYFRTSIGSDRVVCCPFFSGYRVGTDISFCFFPFPLLSSPISSPSASTSASPTTATTTTLLLHLLQLLPDRLPVFLLLSSGQGLQFREDSIQFLALEFLDSRARTQGFILSDRPRRKRRKGKKKRKGMMRHDDWIG